jgi:hypothetical protein
VIRVTSNAGKVAEDLAFSSPALEAEIIRVTRNAGQRLLTAVRSHASGGQGPEIQSGEYRGSWRMEFRSNAKGYAVATVGTDSPQGYRLEMGFQGTDSLGRVFDQQPNPHVEPATAEVREVFVGQVARAVDAWAAKR